MLCREAATLSHQAARAWSFGAFVVLALLTACNRDAAQQDRSGSTPIVPSILDRTAQALDSCGNGEWDPETEECDISLGSASEACSGDCEVQNILVSQDLSPFYERSVGTSRHPSAVGPFGFGVAYLEFLRPDPELEEILQQAGDPTPTEPLPVVRAQLFARDGERLSSVTLSSGIQTSFATDAALAALPDGSFVATFESFDVDDDELGIALRRIDPDGEVDRAQVANSEPLADQYDPDILRIGSELIVAWTDDSNAASAPDLRFRRFGADLSPLGDEQTLAETEAVEGGVALSSFGASFAAAWRAGQVDGTETLVVEAQGDGLRWTVSGYAPANASDRPALVALEDDVLLVVFSVGTAPPGHDLFDVGRLRVAVLHPGNTGEVTPCDPGPNTETFGEPTVSQGQPTATALQTEAYIGWRTSLVPGNALGEEVWQRNITWPSGIQDCSELDELYGMAQTIPSAAEHSVGDQRHPALVADRGLLIATWEDFAQTLDDEQAVPELLLRVTPFDTFCSIEDPCEHGEGHCENDEECEGDLKCGHQNGAAFGFRSNFNVCIPCGNGVLDTGEACDDGIQTAECNANCTLPFCGDGFVNSAGEQCDNGTPDIDSTLCNANCTLALCGDDYVNEAAGEECEPLQPGVSDADCDTDCTLPACGDGVLNPGAGETCELSDASCPLDCGLGTCPSGGCVRLESRLLSIAPNNGEIRPKLRLTNLSSQTLDLSEYSIRYWFTDPSTASYELVVIWDPAFVVEGALAVIPVSPPFPEANKYVHIPLEGNLGPDGAQLSLDLSFRHPGFSPILLEGNDYSYLEVLNFTENTTITVYRNGDLVWGEEPQQPAVCGNGIVESGEDCDDEGESAECNDDCTFAECGDGTVNPTAGEQCDPGDDPNCLADCSGPMLCANASGCLHVKYHHYTDDTPTNEQVKFAFELVNNSPDAIPFADITLRYWFTYEPSGSFQTAVDHTDVAGFGAFVDHGGNHGALSPARGGADYYWETGFTSGAGTLAAGTTSGAVLIRGQNDPWSPFNENDDYSYIDTITATITTTITLYVDGELVWGIEPSPTSAVCGNGAAEDFEQCDDAGPSANCDADCTFAVCGDGTVNATAGEACDPGADPTCRPDCLGPLLCTDSASCLHVRLRHYSSDTPTNNQLRPSFTLVNNGPSAVTLANLTLRYWFTKEPSGTFQPSCDSSTSSPGGCSVVVPGGNHGVVNPALSGANYYWQTGFTSSAGSLAPGASFGQVRLKGQTNPLANFNENNDYSYLNTTTSTITTKVTLYLDGILVWGQEPPPAPPVCPNNIVEGTEECDTGGQSATCDADCTFVICGDGTVNTAAGEVCDPGSNPQCKSDCSGFNACTNASTCLHVTYAHYPDDQPNDSTIKVQLNVVNNSNTSVQLGDTKIRYWLTKEPPGLLEAACDWSAIDGGCSSIVPLTAQGTVSPTKPTANYYWELGFTPRTLAPGQSSGSILARANIQTTWALLDESNDYSYANWSTPAPRTQIGLYVNGILTWGVAP